MLNPENGYSQKHNGSADGSLLSQLLLRLIDSHASPQNELFCNLQVQKVAAVECRRNDLFNTCAKKTHKGRFQIWTGGPWCWGRGPGSFKWARACKKATGRLVLGSWRQQDYPSEDGGGGLKSSPTTHVCELSWNLYKFHTWQKYPVDEVFSMTKLTSVCGSSLELLESFLSAPEKMKQLH